MAENHTLDNLLDAAIAHVPFDGWSKTTFDAACEDVGINPAHASALCPRGAVDLARAYHERGDQLMLERLGAMDLSELRFRDRIAAAVKIRLEVSADKEVVRRGVTLFSLPHLVPDGTRLLWQTCDHIWTALGDSSRDINWYSKRATLAGVYSATLLFWLGDDSEGEAASWAFLDRRIDDVMQIEKLKAQARENAVLKSLFAGPKRLLDQVKAPAENRGAGLPGRW